MAVNPLVSQGTLSRLRASVIWPQAPALNITSPFLDKEGISMALQGETTQYLDTMTGSVTSPQPYQMIDVTIHILKSQNLAALYKAQMELNSLLGDGVIRPDAATLPPYSISNSSILSVAPLLLNGTQAGFVITCKGIYQINSSLWNF
jgi:hypothetical protein